MQNKISQTSNESQLEQSSLFKAVFVDNIVLINPQVDGQTKGAIRAATKVNSAYLQHLFLTLKCVI